MMLDKPYKIRCCKDGTLTVTTPNQPAFNSSALPVYSCDTPEEAEGLIRAVGKCQYIEHSDLPGKPWYRWVKLDRPEGLELEDLDDLAELLQHVERRLGESVREAGKILAEHAAKCESFRITQALSGSEEILDHGVMTLGAATKMIEAMEEASNSWEAGGFCGVVAPGIRSLEGSDFVAHEPKTMMVKYQYSDHWEPWPPVESKPELDSERQMVGELAPKCPVSIETILRAMLSGKFKAMTEEDLEGWAGIEGDGYIWETSDFVVILDITPEALRVEVDVEDGEVWAMPLFYEEFESIGSH